MPNEKLSREALEKKIQMLESENKILSDFAELSSEWFWEQDHEFRFTRFFGLSTASLQRDQNLFLGKVRWEMPVQGISQEELQAHIDCCHQHRAFRDFEYSVPGDNNRLQRYSISGTPFFDSEGNFAGYRGIGRNITELHSARMAVVDSQRQLLQILQGSPIATFVIDKEHRITHWNKACEALTGYSAEEKIGLKDSWRGFYPEPRPTLADLVVDQAPFAHIKQHYDQELSNSALISGAYTAESFFPEIGENGLWLHFNASPLFDQAGEVSGAIETLQDITARINAEKTERKHFQALQSAHQELQNTIQQLAEAKKLASLGRLIAGLAHELNTPLGNMRLGADSSKNSLDQLRSAYESNAITRDRLESFFQDSSDTISIIQQNLNRSINLITRFKELSSDSLPSTPESFAPKNRVDDIFALFSGYCTDRNITLFNHLPEELRITNFSESFEQVIYCLLENSLTHGVKSGEGVINIDYEECPDGIKFSFTDNGKGMTEKDCEHAFDPFYTSILGQGTSGLGLYRVYNLINTVMGGKIELKDNHPGLKTVFYLQELNCQGPSSLK